MRFLDPLRVALFSAWSVGLLGVVLPLPSLAEEGLGRLFTSAAQRAAMGAAVAERAEARLEGVVWRPDGEVVVWIDGRRVTKGAAFSRGTNPPLGEPFNSKEDEEGG